MHAQRAEGFDVGVARDLRLVAVALVLPAQDVVGAQRPHRGEDIGLVAVHGLEVAARRRLHRQQRDDLEQVVLHHVAQAARAFVERAAALDAELLGQRDLHAGDVVAVPDRLEKGVGEAEVQDVHDRLLAQEVIDAEDRVLGEGAARDPVELARRGQVAAERLFDDDPPAFGQPGGVEAADDRGEQRRRDGEVERRALRAAQGDVAAPRRWLRPGSRRRRSAATTGGRRVRAGRPRRLAARRFRGPARGTARRSTPIEATPITGTFSAPRRLIA